MMKQDKYAVIFDMDGVLVPDSPRISWNSFREAIKSYGVTLPERDTGFAGKSLRDQIAMWNKMYGVNIDFKSFSDMSWQIQLETLEKISADGDLVALLENLKARGVFLSVGTSSQRFRAEKILEIIRLKDYFPVVVTGNDVDKQKPDPAIFLEAARRLDMRPERCIVIEDAANGIEAAKSGRMRAVGYLNKYNDREDLKGANLLIRSFRELSYNMLVKLLQDKS